MTNPGSAPDNTARVARKATEESNRLLAIAAGKQRKPIVITDADRPDAQRPKEATAPRGIGFLPIASAMSLVVIVVVLIAQQVGGGSEDPASSAMFRAMNTLRAGRVSDEWIAQASDPAIQAASKEQLAELAHRLGSEPERQRGIIRDNEQELNSWQIVNRKLVVGAAGTHLIDARAPGRWGGLVHLQRDGERLVGVMIPASPPLAAIESKAIDSDGAQTLTTKAWFAKQDASAAQWALLHVRAEDDGIYHLIACGPTTLVELISLHTGSLVALRSQPFPILRLRSLTIDELLP